MNKKELVRILAPVDPDKAEVKITLESSADGKEASIKFESQTKMSAADFLLALCEFANDLALELYNKGMKN